MSEDLNINEVMAQRFAIEEQIAIMSGKHKGELAPLVEVRDMCEAYIKDVMLKQGLQNLKTDAGMALFVSKDSAGVDNFDLFTAGLVADVPPLDSPDFNFLPEEWQHIVSHFAAHASWHFLNKVANKTAVKEYIEEHKKPPPGIKYDSYKDLSWRKGKG